MIKNLGMRLDTKGRKHRWGLFNCPTCNTEIELRTAAVKQRGKVSNCKDCKTYDRNTKHGESTTDLYKIWYSMIKRCYSKKAKAYKYYGAIGVIVCDEWKNDYLVFKEWAIKNGYKKGLFLDKDILSKELNIVPSIYSPDTCKYITHSESTIETNTRNTKEYRLNKRK